MNVLHHHLEPVEAPRFSDLNLSGEPLSKVFKHYPVTGSEKCKHVFDVMLLALIEFFPVLEILSQIDFLSGPKCGFLVLVHLPDVVVLDREQYKSVGVFLKQRFWQGSLSLGVLRILLRHDRRYHYLLLILLEGHLLKLRHRSYILTVLGKGD